MKLLYLVADQEMVDSVARFVVQVAGRMGSHVHILGAAGEQKKLEAIRESYQALQGAFEGVAHSAEFVLNDPVDAMVDALEKESHTMVLIGVRRRRNMIPSRFRMISHRLIRRANVPVMLIRSVSRSLDRMLVCTGGLEISAPVVALSARLAGQAGLKATLLTVSAAVPSMYTGMEEMEETLEEILASETPLGQHLRHSAELLNASGISADIQVRHGDVVEAILEETVEGGYDLVVLGETEGSTLRGMLLGNVTQQIINRAPSAVLIVK